MMSTKERIKDARRIEIDRPMPPLEGQKHKPRRQPKPFFNAWRLGYLAVLILSVVTFLPALRGLKVWDDDALLDGSGIGGGTSILSALTKPFLGAYFRPLVSLTFYIENKLWYGTPFYYHQTNILIHMLTCAALMGFVLKAFGSRRIALLSGALFAVQPVQVSTVAWIGGRTDSLGALLVVLFGYTLLLGVRSSGSKQYGWIACSVVAFFLAAVTKEQIVALVPLVPMMLKAFGPKDRKPDFKAYARLATPYVLASLLFAALWVIFYPNPFMALARSPIDQMLTAGRTTVYYSLLFLAPSSEWIHTLSLGNFERAGVAAGIFGVVLLAALLAGVVVCYRKNKQIGWFAWFVALFMLPVSNIAPLPSLLVAPYRAGVAGLGVAVLLAWLLANVRYKATAAIVGSAFLVWCGVLTFWGCEQWKDPMTIFSRITSEDPSSIVARRNMSSYLMKAGKPQQAADQMKQILTMLYGSSDWQNPKSAYAQFQTSETLNRKVVENQGNQVQPEAWLGELFAQLGFAQASLNDFDASRKSFTSASWIDPKNPRARVGLAQYAMYEHRYSEAEQDLRIAVAVHPSDPALYGLLAQVYVQEHELAKADQAYRQSIEIEPWFGPTYQNLAEVQVKEGDVVGAIETLKSALNCRVLDSKGIQRRIAEIQSVRSNARSSHESRMQL